MLKEIATEMKELEANEKRNAELRKIMSDKLEVVKAEKGTSFRAGSMYYQIRKRGELNYICDSDKPFGSWLKKENRA